MVGAIDLLHVSNPFVSASIRRAPEGTPDTNIRHRSATLLNKEPNP